MADVVVRPDGDDVGPLVEAGPSRALLPELQPPVGPEEDPGDLFEPVANLPFASPVEAVPCSGGRAGATERPCIES